MGILGWWHRRQARRRAWLLTAALLAVCVALLAADATRPPERQVAARAALAGIGWYQAHVSGRFGPICRFNPTCSVYARTVIERHGLVRGGWLAARRIVRCGPWTPLGTKDPPI